MRMNRHQRRALAADNENADNENIEWFTVQAPPISLDELTSESPEGAKLLMAVFRSLNVCASTDDHEVFGVVTNLIKAGELEVEMAHTGSGNFLIRRSGAKSPERPI